MSDLDELPTVVTEPDPAEHRPLLQRLNRRGFRLSQLADVLGVGFAVVLPMLVRYGLDWPTYVPWRYAVSFGLFVVLVITGAYLGGMYEREPRLGAPSALPPAVRVVATALLIFLLLDQIGIGFLRTVFEISVERTFPFPIPNLVATSLLAPVALVTTRRLGRPTWRCSAPRGCSARRATRSPGSRRPTSRCSSG